MDLGIFRTYMMVEGQKVSQKRVIQDRKYSEKGTKPGTEIVEVTDI